MSARPRLLLFFALLVAALLVWSYDARPLVHAQSTPPALKPFVSRAVGFAETAPLAEIAELPEPAAPPADDAAFDRVVPNKQLPGSLNQNFDLPPTADPVLQGDIGALSVPSPSVSFEGLASADNVPAFGFRVSPPDPNGDVGPNHYVQMVNLLVRVFDKAGNPLTPPFKLSSLFAALGGPCAATDDGDPVVLYDPLADRWLLSQFCTAGTPNTHQMVAISQTPDPTGAYFVYDFVMPNLKFNDYPKFGAWPDAYYMTDNQFDQAGTAFLGGGVFAFDRAKLLAGDPSASYIYFDLEPLDPSIGGMLPSDLDGAPPPPGTPNYFSYFTANEFGDPGDGLRLFEFHADFNNPAASTFTERPESPVSVAAFDPRNPSGRSDIEQPAPAATFQYLDSIQDRLMFRLQYRNAGGHESLVVTHTVNASGLVPSTQANHRAGIRYYELRRTLPGGAFTVNEQATYSPDTDNRWMGSAAMDGSGNLAVGYSVSSLATFPSIRYAGRLASDPPNGLFQGETTLVAGTGVQRSPITAGNPGNRWGDYSGLTVDPSDDCTFWYTNEYYTAASQVSSSVGWLTRIGSFTFPGCTPHVPSRVAGLVVNAGTGLPLAGARVLIDGSQFAVTGPAGTYSIPVAPGTHDVSATGPNFSTDTEAGVSVGSGTTTVRTLTISPLGADVSIAKFGPTSAAYGDVLTYNLFVSNHGPLGATGVTVSDATPAGTVFLSVASSQGSCTTPASGAAGPVTCAIGMLADTETATVTIGVRIGASAGEIVNTATVTADQADVMTSNNTATASTSIECARLVKDGALGADGPEYPSTHGTQTGRLNRFTPGSVCLFQKPNPGLATATGARLYDAYQFTNVTGLTSCVTVTIDAMACIGTNFLYAAAYAGSFNPANPSQNYLADTGGSPSSLGEIGFTLDPGATTVVVVHEVTPGAGCGRYQLRVSGVVPCASADVAISKAASIDPVITGSMLTYDIGAANNGPDEAIGLSISDALPADTTFLSMATPAGWSCTTPPVGATGAISCTAESLASAASATVSPTVAVSCGLPTGAAIANAASGGALTLDTNPVNNAAAVTVQALNPPPAITPPANVSLSTGRHASSCSLLVADAALGTATTTDNCAGVTTARSGVPAGNVFPVGTTVLTYTATDSGGSAVSATQRVTIADATRPIVNHAYPTPFILWPPKLQMVPVTVHYDTSDNCGPVTTTLSVTSTDVWRGRCRNHTGPDWEIMDAHHVRLRAERVGFGGRIYTITIHATDAAGNASDEQVYVLVPPLIWFWWW